MVDRPHYFFVLFSFWLSFLAQNSTSVGLSIGNVIKYSSSTTTNKNSHIYQYQQHIKDTVINPPERGHNYREQTYVLRSNVNEKEDFSHNSTSMPFCMSNIDMGFVIIKCVMFTPISSKEGLQSIAAWCSKGTE